MHLLAENNDSGDVRMNAIESRYVVS